MDLRGSICGLIPGNTRELLIKTTNGMAVGLFGTLIIGTVIAVFADIPGLSPLKDFADLLKGLMGAGIGLGVALQLKKEGVAVVAVTAAGMAGTMIFDLGDLRFHQATDPLSCYFQSLAAFAGLSLLRRRTPVDLIIVPLAGILSALAYCVLLSDAVHHVTLGIGWVIEASFSIAPLPMCIAVQVLVGMALTAPISSVAICVAVQIGDVPLAAGAALVGCCVQMVGMAVQTSKDNSWGPVIAVGLGTSMLQFKNILSKPVIWLPTIICSAVLAPSAWAFGFATDSVGAGMGTSGLVGLIDTFRVMGYDALGMAEVVGVCVVLAAVSTYITDLLFRRAGIIADGDFRLEQDL